MLKQQLVFKFIFFCTILSLTCCTQSRSEYYYSLHPVDSIEKNTDSTGYKTQQHQSLQDSTSRLEMAAIIYKWLNYYKLDLSKAWLTEQTVNCFNCAPDKESIYYRSYEKGNDNGKLIDVDYSPDKAKYISLGLVYENDKNGKLHHLGWDDNQEIYLTDRSGKENNLILWLGSSSFAEGVFWKDNNEFYITGWESRDHFTFFIYDFNISAKTIKKFEITAVDKPEAHNYMNDIYLPGKGFIVD